MNFDKDQLLKLAQDNIAAISQQTGVALESAQKQTTAALDALDSDLEKIETRATEALNQARSSVLSWWQSATAAATAAAAGTATGAEAGSADAAYTDFLTKGNFSARVLSELQACESDKTLYEKAQTHSFTQDEKKELESLAKDTNLRVVQLQPQTSLSEDDFWQTYFALRSSILEKDALRKEHAATGAKQTSKDGSAASGAAEDDEEFNWDDE